MRRNHTTPVAEPLRTRQATGIAGLFTLIVACGPAVSGDVRRHPEPATEEVAPPPSVARNAILIVVDSLGPDVFTDALMPALTEFSSGGVSLEGRSTAAWAKPAVAGILTGVHPGPLSMMDQNSRLPGGVWTLPLWLGCSDFVSGSFVANGYIAGSFGFDVGWDRHTNYIRENVAHRADDLLTGAAEWIRGRGDSRFFAYIHLIDAHLPYDPPAEFAPEDHGLRPRPEEVIDWLQGLRDSGQSPTEEQREWVTSLYEGEVRYVDDAIGRFLSVLRNDGILSETLVVVTSDHREVPGDPALSLLNVDSEEPGPLLPVPLVYVGPGAPPVQPGPADTTSIPRHLLNALGISIRTDTREFGVAPPTRPDECPANLTMELCTQLGALGYAVDCARCVNASVEPLACE